MSEKELLTEIKNTLLEIVKYNNGKGLPEFSNINNPNETTLNELKDYLNKLKSEKSIERL